MAKQEIDIGVEGNDGTGDSIPVQVRSTGLYWPTDGLSFAPDGQIGTSNKAARPVTLLPSAPCMLVVLSKTCLDIAIDAMQAAPYWDAPI